MCTRGVFTINTSLISRLYYLACELQPDLPPVALMRMLGKSWTPIITAGAAYGLAGSAAALPTVSYDQLTQFFMEGSKSGSEPSLTEFRAALSGVLYEKITGNESISILDQISLAGKLGQWLDGRDSANGDGEMDFDAVIETPPFTKTGFWPLDQIAGERGLPQEVVTLLARPESGKTTVALSVACEWRRANIGPVWFIQTELAASAMRMKIDGMMQPGEKLWRPGIDRLVFGRRSADNALDYLIAHPDPDRLVIFDSIGGHCGQGDSSASRERFAELFDKLMQVKNSSRMALACGHVKRGVDMADIESAAGSSAVERFSGCLFYMDKDPTTFPDGTSQIQIESLKNRYHGHVRRFNFRYDYVTGTATDVDEIDQAMEALS